jgi:thioredoxin 1
MRLHSAFLPAALLGALLTAPALSAGDAVNQANAGQPINLTNVLVKGKVNIVDFYSKFCPPCMRISPLLEKLGEKRSDLQIVKVDINRPGIEGIDWQSPLAKQFQLQSIPHFKIYDGSGKLMKEGDGAYQEVVAMLKGQKLIN